MPPQVLIPYRAALPAAPARAVATALQRTSLALAHLARRLMPTVAAPLQPTQLEFHAEAGAPEGALYADGVLVALVPGVTRL